MNILTGTVEHEQKKAKWIYAPSNYREILRLDSLGINKTDIAASCECSRNIVISTLQRAKACGLKWLLPDNMSNKDLMPKRCKVCRDKKKVKFKQIQQEEERVKFEKMLSASSYKYIEKAEVPMTDSDTSLLKPT